jgi:hypothetical protein
MIWNNRAQHMEGTVQLDERAVKSGQAVSRQAAKNAVIWLINKTLARRNIKLIGRMSGVRIRMTPRAHRTRSFNPTG